MSNPVLSSAHTTVRNQASLDYLDVGAGNAKLRLYNGTQPAFGGSETTLLAEFTLTDPAGTIVGTDIVLTLPSDAVVVAGGTATWARILNASGAIWADCEVSLATGTAPVKLVTTTLTAGGSVKMTSAQFG